MTDSELFHLEERIRGLERECQEEWTKLLELIHGPAPKRIIELVLVRRDIMGHCFSPDTLSCYGCGMSLRDFHFFRKGCR